MEILNYDQNNGLTLNTYRNTGFACDKKEFIESVVEETKANVSIDDNTTEFICSCVVALEDGEFLSKYNWTQEQVEDAHSMFNGILL